MSELHSFTTGYEPAILALAFVLVYFVFASILLRVSTSRRATVSRYEPPRGGSPGVAAWLLERELPRAIAAAIVNMAAKRYLTIEQSGDLYSITRLEPELPARLEPEEDVLARLLFRDYDSFDFDQSSPQLTKAILRFRWALENRRYFAKNFALSIPAWIVSSVATVFALVRGNFFESVSQLRFLGRNAGMYPILLLFIAFGSFVVAIRTLPGPLEKLASRLPWSIAPRRPWTGADSRSATFLLVALLGVALLAWMSTIAAALLTTAFLIVNTTFYYSLQGPTPAGRQILEQLVEYRRFLSEVDADAISRVNSSERAPDELREKDAYAIAFHVDLGWGEQFVTSIADLIEWSGVFGKTRDGDDLAR
jgi:Predicted membrane protein (DUF2207)